jgi:hypothetical protein
VHHVREGQSRETFHFLKRTPCGQGAEGQDEVWHAEKTGEQREQDQGGINDGRSAEHGQAEEPRKGLDEARSRYGSEATSRERNLGKKERPEDADEEEGDPWPEPGAEPDRVAQEPTKGEKERRGEGSPEDGPSGRKGDRTRTSPFQ